MSSLSSGVLVVAGFPHFHRLDSSAEIERLVDHIESVWAASYESVYLVASDYPRYIARSDLPENVTIVADHPANVFQPRLNKTPFDVKLFYQAPLTRTPLAAVVAGLRDVDALVTFLCVDERIARNAWQLAAVVHTERLDARRWAFASSTRELFAAPDAVVLPNIFRGAEELAPAELEALAPRERAALRELIVEGVCTIRAYLRAGFSDHANHATVPGWAIQTYGTWLSLLTGLFKIVPGAYDINHQAEIMISSNMRNLYFSLSLWVVSNFLMYHNPVPAMKMRALLAEHAPPPNANEHTTRNYAAWSSPPLWDAVYDKLVASQE